MKALVTCPPLLGMIGRYRPLFEQPGMEVAVPKLVHTKEVVLLPMDSYLRQHQRCAFGLHNALTTANASVGAYQCDCGLEDCGLSHYHIGGQKILRDIHYGATFPLATVAGDAISPQLIP